MTELSEKQIDSLQRLVKELTGLPKETAWVEFKENRYDPEDIGQYISALSNAAALHQRAKAFMVWGIEDGTHSLVGTGFSPSDTKKGNEELENWLLHLLSPRIDFAFYSIEIDGKQIVILEIDRASQNPVSFSGIEYIRIGSYKKKLKEFPEKERALWRIFDTTPFEELFAAEDVSDTDILQLIDYPAYFDLLGIPLPDNRKGIFDRLQKEGIILSANNGAWHISNLGAVLFSKNIEKFKAIKRKAIRVIVYKDKTRCETIREQLGEKAYANGFEGLIQFVNSLLPRNEVLGSALRKEVSMYPEIAVRELVANALIHQDFHIKGTGPNTASSDKLTR
jgi:predicted HTH transcriptional regulator